MPPVYLFIQTVRWCMDTHLPSAFVTICREWYAISKMQERGWTLYRFTIYMGKNFMGIPTRRRILFLILWIGKRIFLAACLQKMEFPWQHTSKSTMVYTVGNITYFHLLKEFILLFFLLLGILFCTSFVCAFVYYSCK